MAIKETEKSDKFLTKAPKNKGDRVYMLKQEIRENKITDADIKNLKGKVSISIIIDFLRENGVSNYLLKDSTVRTLVNKMK